MDGPCQLALAGTRFAKDEDVGVSDGDLAGGFKHRHHGRAMGVEAVLGFAYFTFQGFQARRKLAHLQLLGSGQAQLVGAARLDQVVGSAGLDGIHCGVDR
ncbi:hypothetical protein D3C79_761670 [compost metagenome]